MALDDEAVLWRIGEPGRDQEQFDDSWFVARMGFPDVFRIGVSDPATDWPRFQPGPLHGNTGYQEESVAVAFDLDEAEDATLTLEVYAGHGPTPALDLDVNGHVGRIHLRPDRTDRANLNGPPTLVAGWAVVDVPVDASWLVAGDNLLTIITVQPEPADPDELTPSIPETFNWFGSGIAWGGLCLRRRPEGVAPAPAVQVEASPLYVDREGALHELVDVILEGVGCFATATVALTVEGVAHTAPIDGAGREFGQWRVAVPVPAWDGTVSAQVRVTVDGEQVVERAVDLEACRRWTIHLVPHVHLDIGYTDHAAKVMELHSRNLDRAVDILRRNPDWAFTIDGSMIVDDHLRTRRPEAVAEVVAAIRDGRLGLNAYSMLFLTGLASLEECYRAAYPARRQADQHDLPVDVAHLTDVPSYSSSLPALLRDHGIDRFVGIQNHGRAATVDSDELHLVSPFRWQGIGGDEVLTFFSDAYAQLRLLFGDPATTVGLAEVLPRLLRRFDRPDYLPDHFPIVGSHADNEDVAGGYVRVVDRWNARYAWPRMRYSTFTDYFDAVEEHREQLPVVTGDGGSYWEDGVGAHAASMATYRRAQDAMGPVESLSALVGQAAPELRVDRPGLDATWDALLLGCEHTWSSAHSIKRHHSHTTQEMTDWKVHQIEHAAHLVGDAAHRAMSQLGEAVGPGGPAVLLYNGLAWEREVEVEVELSAGQWLAEPDLSAAEVELVGTRDDLDVVLVRRTVEPFGYVVWPVGRSGPPRTSATERLEPDAEVVVGDWVLRLDGGHVASLRRGSRELLDAASPWGLGDVLHVLAGGTPEGRGLGRERTALSDFGPRLPLPDLDVDRVAFDAFFVRPGPRSTVVELRGRGRTLPEVVLRVRLRADSERVDVEVALDKEAELAKESVYVAFPFAVDDPVVRYDRQIGWVDPVTDHQAGACNEWFTTLHGVRVGDIAWCSMDAPLFALGEPVRGRWPRQATPSGTILSWPMNNHWGTNYLASQEGRVHLRYAFRAGVNSDGDAARFGREARGGALDSVMVYQDKVVGDAAPTAPLRGALLSLPEAWLGTDVHVGAAQRGDGSVIVRVADLDGQARTLPLAGLRCFDGSGLRFTHRCDALELDLEPFGDEAQLVLDAWSVVTLRAARVLVPE